MYVSSGTWITHVPIWAEQLKKDVKNLEGITRRIQGWSEKASKFWGKKIEALKQKIFRF